MVPVSTLGDDALQVSKLCIGCWQFNDGEMDGSKTWSGQPYQTSKSIVDKALELGINFFDTAEVSQNNINIKIYLYMNPLQYIHALNAVYSYSCMEEAENNQLYEK